jgi:hypothetical protein
VPDPIYDDTDRRLMAALHGVEIPTDLQSRLERSLQGAMREQELLESSLVEKTPTLRRASHPLWNRRTAIAAAVAAGLGGIALGYRQLTQPLSQAQLVEITQNLLDQVKGTTWHSLTAEEAKAVSSSLQGVGFLRQVRNVSLIRLSKLQRPRNIQDATAYDFGSELVLFDLTIERGVQRLSHSLTVLPWSRSDTLAFAMSSKQRTLVFAGPASIRQHILTAPTT